MVFLVRPVRQARGVSLRRLARHIDKDFSALARQERGEYPFSFLDIEDISYALDVAPETLFLFEPRPPGYPIVPIPLVGQGVT